MHKQGHYGNIFNFWNIWKKVWGRVITPLWCLKAPSMATKKWIFEFYTKFGFRNHLQTFWPQWLVKSELSLGLIILGSLTKQKSMKTKQERLRFQFQVHFSSAKIRQKRDLLHWRYSSIPFIALQHVCNI